jgi:hypothetical protein
VGCINSVSCCGSFVFVDESAEQIASPYRDRRPSLARCVSRLLPPERWCCFAVSPQTLRRWHRALLAGGRRRCRRRPGRPPLAAETRGVIRRLARENPRWGYMRIEGDLLKLGIGVSPPRSRPCCAARASGRRRGGSARAGRSPYALRGDDYCPRGDARPGRVSPRRLERRCACRHRIDRTLATDPNGTNARPTSKCSKRDVKATADRGRPRDHAPHPPVGPRHLVTPSVAATERTHEPPARTEILYPTGSQSWTLLRSGWRSLHRPIEVNRCGDIRAGRRECASSSGYRPRSGQSFVPARVSVHRRRAIDGPPSSCYRGVANS